MGKPPGPGGVAETPGLIEWEAVFWRLMHGRMRLRPWEVRQLRLPDELAWALDDDVSKARPPPGSEPLPPGGAAEYARRRRALGADDILAEARRKSGFHE